METTTQFLKSLLLQENGTSDVTLTAVLAVLPTHLLLEVALIFHSPLTSQFLEWLQFLAIPISMHMDQRVSQSFSSKTKKSVLTSFLWQWSGMVAFTLQQLWQVADQDLWLQALGQHWWRLAAKVIFRTLNWSLLLQHRLKKLWKTKFPRLKLHLVTILQS